MKLTTSKGKTFETRWAHAPTGIFGDLMLELRDERPIPEIAADFDGCEHFHRESENQGDMDYDGYTELISISRPNRADMSIIGVTLRRTERS